MEDISDELKHQNFIFNLKKILEQKKNQSLKNIKTDILVKKYKLELFSKLKNLDNKIYFNKINSEFKWNSSQYYIDYISWENTEHENNFIINFEYERIDCFYIDNKIDSLDEININNIIYNFIYRHIRKFPLKYSERINFYLGNPCVNENKNIKLLSFLDTFDIVMECMDFEGYIRDENINGCFNDYLKIEKLNYIYYHKNHNWKNFKEFIPIYYD